MRSYILFMSVYELKSPFKRILKFILKIFFAYATYTQIIKQWFIKIKTNLKIDSSICMLFRYVKKCETHLKILKSGSSCLYGRVCDSFSQPWPSLKFFVGVFPVYFSILCSIPSPYTLDATINSCLQIVTTKNVSGHCLMNVSWLAKLSLVENHWIGKECRIHSLL